MKKFLCFACALMLVLVSGLTFVGCKSGEQTGKVRINEVTHSVFYAPLYVAINNGYLKENGIDVELTNGGGSDSSMTALLSGQADIALMGPETVVYVASGGSTAYPKVFGQLTKRDGSFLISKTKYTNFDWKTDLENKTVIAGRKGGLPAMTFEWVCNSNKLYNGVNLTLDTSTAFNMMVPVFESTSAEFCTMFEPTASEFVKSGKGYLVGSVGEYSGEIPYTCFMAKPNYISSNSELILNFLKSIKKAYNFIMESPSSEVAKSLKPSFETTSLESLASAVESYKSIDAWTSSPAMTEDSYIRLLQVMSNAGEITKNVAFGDVVDNTYAKQI
ncbi:MAG: ABC transporter substrate-binding protein [Clostridia bacterium]|nr:ABC transporter substrate-binding protein [Clostridia bacterium]